MFKFSLTSPLPRRHFSTDTEKRVKTKLYGSPSLIIFRQARGNGGCRVHLIEFLPLWVLLLEILCVAPILGHFVPKIQYVFILFCILIAVDNFHNPWNFVISDTTLSLWVHVGAAEIERG